MKQSVLLVIALCLTLLLFGCIDTKPNHRENITFYYPQHEISGTAKETVLAEEIRKDSGSEKDLEELLQIYLRGPLNETLDNPFPAGLRILSLHKTSDTLYITLSRSLSDMSGLKLTLACASLSKTCMELADVTAVHITAEGGALLDGASNIFMDQDNLLLLDNGMLR